MMDFIMVPAVMTIITLGVYKLFELFVCKKERIMLIEKMDERGLLPKLICYYVDTVKDVLRDVLCPENRMSVGWYGTWVIAGLSYLLCDDSQLLYCGQRLDV